MTAAQKLAWTTALRSGEYEQIDSYFEHAGKFCCLGVLCVVTGAPTTVDDAGNWTHVEHLLKDTGVRTQMLVRMNDAYKNSFSEIADFIDGAVAVSP